MPARGASRDEELAAALRPRIGALEQEVFVAVLLDAKHRIKRHGYPVISVGSLTAYRASKTPSSPYADANGD